MKITTERDMIRSVAKRWRQQYEPFRVWDNRPTMFGPVKNKEQVALALDKLDPETATTHDVYNIIGNFSWTNLECNECGRDVEAILIVGEEPDYESNTASICQECANKVAQIVWPSI